MDIFFADPSEVPLPPAEVRIRLLDVEPRPDGKRVRVSLEVDPFQKRPSVDLTLFDAHGRELSSAFIIESMTRMMELVMHLRSPASGLCTLQAVLYFSSLPEPGIADPGHNPAEPGPGASVAGTSGPGPDSGPIEIIRQVVDTRQATFEIPG
jgi:hypothetical protein